MIIQKKLELHTKGFNHIIDITSALQNYVSDERINDGYVLVFVPGATGAITTIEYEDGLVYDIKSAFKRLIPKDMEYRHELRWHDGNGHSHIRASILGPSITTPFKDGQLILGTWQQIIFVEFDNKPHNRNLVVQVVGE